MQGSNTHSGTGAAPLAHTEVARFEFEVVPAGWTGGPVAPFEPVILEVPTMGLIDQAARRAYWSAFHLLGAQGIDVDEFEVYEFVGGQRGRKVGPKGFETEAALTVAEQGTALDMAEQGSMVAKVALTGEGWPTEHVRAAVATVKREHARREALLDRADWTPQTEGSA